MSETGERRRGAEEGGGGGVLEEGSGGGSGGGGGGGGERRRGMEEGCWRRGVGEGVEEEGSGGGGWRRRGVEEGVVEGWKKGVEERGGGREGSRGGEWRRRTEGLVESHSCSIMESRFLGFLGLRIVFVVLQVSTATCPSRQFP